MAQSIAVLHTQLPSVSDSHCQSLYYPEYAEMETIGEEAIKHCTLILLCFTCRVSSVVDSRKTSRGITPALTTAYKIQSTSNDKGIEHACTHLNSFTITICNIGEGPTSITRHLLHCAIIVVNIKCKTHLLVIMV